MINEGNGRHFAHQQHFEPFSITLERSIPVHFSVKLVDADYASDDNNKTCDSTLETSNAIENVEPLIISTDNRQELIEV